MLVYQRVILVMFPGNIPVSSPFLHPEKVKKIPSDVVFTQWWFASPLHHQKCLLRLPSNTTGFMTIGYDWVSHHPFRCFSHQKPNFFGWMNPDVGHFWAILLGKTTGSGGGGFDSAGAPMAYIPSISIVYIYVYIHTYIYIYRERVYTYIYIHT